MKKYLLMSVAAVAVVAAGGVAFYHNYYYDDTGITNVFKAAEESTPSKVAKYLRINKPNLKHADDNGYTLITYAAANKDPKMVKAVIDAGAQINVEAKDGITPMLMAILNQNAEAVKLLLDAGANPNFVNKNGWTPLAFAVSNANSPEIVQLLLNRKADVNFRLDGKIGLMNLALQTQKSAKIIEELINAGINLFEVDENGNNFIIKAVILKSDPEVIKLLAKNGVDVNQKNLQKDTALKMALYKSSDAKVVQALIDAGADLTDNPKEILNYAVVRNQNPEIIDVLAKAKLPMKLPDDDFSLIAETVQVPNQEKMLDKVLRYDNLVNKRNSRGQTPLFAAMVNGQSLEVLDMLAKEGADITVVDNNGINLLMYAALNNVDKYIMEYLLGKNIDVFAKDKAGNTVLHYAASRFHRKEVLLMLLDEFAKDGKHQDEINQVTELVAMQFDAPVLQKFAEKGGKIDFSKQEVPMLVIAAGKAEMLENVRQMLKMGAKANVTTPDKITPLHMAAASNPNPEMAKMLIEAGADVNAQDKTGLTPLMLTAMYNPNGDAVAEVLLEAKANPKLRDSQGKTYFDMLRERQVAKPQEVTEVPENVGEATPVPEAPQEKK